MPSWNDFLHNVSAQVVAPVWCRITEIGDYDTGASVQQ